MVDIRQIPKAPPKVDSSPLSNRQDIGQKEVSWEFQVEGQRFNFKDGKVLLNQQDLSKHLSEALGHLSNQYWTNLARRLGRYRDFMTMQVEDPEMLNQFMGFISSILGKIYGKIQKKLGETVDGIHFYLEDGQLLINGINAHACLQMVRKRRTKKGLVFLKGLRQRMNVLLSNRASNNSYERIRDTLQKLAREMDFELQKDSEIPDVIMLPPPSPRLLS